MENELFEILRYGIFGGSISLILIGLYAALTKRSLLKIIIGLSIVDGGIHLLLIAIGYVKNGTAPIFSPGYEDAAANMVDPVPQALVLTAIVIGFAVTAVALSLVIRLYRHHHTLEIDEIKNLKW
jgi:multicomponent Na+:H+ antiporter subunit C